MQGEHAKNSQEKFIVIHGQDSHLQRINKENEHDNDFFRRKLYIYMINIFLPLRERDF